MFSLSAWCRTIYWFASDEANASMLRKLSQGKPRIRVVVLNHKIRKPVDIAIAQNLSVQWIQENDQHADFIFYQQADLIITPEGTDFAQKWVKEFDGRELVVGLAAAQNKLFVELLDNPNGGVLFHRSWKFVSVEDGWEVLNVPSPFSYRKSEKPWMSPTLVNEQRPMMDLGYISTDAYIRKLINHARIWPDGDWKQKLLKVYQADKREGIRQTFLRIAKFEESKGKPVVVVPYAGQYKWLIDKMGLQSEYNLIKSV